MQNQDGQLVDLYVPRRCSATNRIIASKDSAAVSINVAHVNAEGRYMGNVSAFNLCGYIRAKCESDVHFSGLWEREQAANGGRL